MQAKFNDWHLEQQAEIKRLLNKPQQGFVQMLDSANRQCTHPLALQADKQGFTSSAADGASVVSNLFAQNAYANPAFSNTAASSILAELPIASAAALRVIQQAKPLMGRVGGVFGTVLAAQYTYNAEAEKIAWSKLASYSDIPVDPIALSQVQFEANSLVGNGMITGVGETILNDRVAENIAKGKQLRNLYESNPRHPIVREALKKAADQGIVIDIAGGNRLDINPEANKPKILITPLPPVGKPNILSTPDERDKIGRLTELPGFHPPSVEELADNKEGFDLHQTDWRDLIFFSDSSEFNPAKEGNHGKVFRDVRYGKIYQDIKEPNTFYTKDRAGKNAHGGEHWKRLKKQGELLIEDAEVDMSGKIMNKNLGTKTRVKIKIKELIGIK